MVLPARRLHYPYEEYLLLLEMSDVRLEYCDGEIYAMAGGTPTHARLAARATALLEGALKGSCQAFSSDLKIRVEETNLAAFPDVSVICGPIQPSPKDKNAAVNPVLLVEITSNSTEEYDRGAKLAHYQRLTSLRAALLISHTEQRLTLHVREGDSWRIHELVPGQSLTLAEPALSIPVEAFYANVMLEN